MSEAIESELVVTEPKSEIVAADPGAVVAAFANYQEIQRALDQAMPNCMMPIQGKLFRKKEYWRGVATAFNLTLECVTEERVVIEGKPISLRAAPSERWNIDDWGYNVVYRATAPNGRSSDGDGSCYASEKLNNKGEPTTMMSEHNVRAHAHTRAVNRAISTLVGFGEVSAEEVNHNGEAKREGGYGASHPTDGGDGMPPKPKRQTKAQATRDTEPPNPNAPTDDDNKMLRKAVTEHAERLLNTAVENEISGAPQDAESMVNALKRAAYARVDSKPPQHDTVSEYVELYAYAVLEDGGKITFCDLEAF